MPSSSPINGRMESNGVDQNEFPSRNGLNSVNGLVESNGVDQNEFPNKNGLNSVNGRVELNGVDQNKLPGRNGLNSVNGNSPGAKLVVTFFARSKPFKENFLSVPNSQNHEEHDMPPPRISPTYEPSFTKLLSSLVSKPVTMVSSQSLSSHVFQLTYFTSSSINPFSIRHEPSITAFEKANSVELVFDLISDQKASHRSIKLAIFDMDSTLINEEVIDELARSISVTPAVSAITARAMNGEIDFAQSLRERLVLLKGVDTKIWLKPEKSITVAAGAKELCKQLRRRGIVTAVASGGFAPMVDWLKDQLGLDYAFANHISRLFRNPLPSLAILNLPPKLVVSPPTPSYPHPHLSGQLSPNHPMITPTEKRDILISLAEKHSIPLSETMAVGDGSNDLLMLGAAGLGIAWRAKEKVQREAPQRLNGESLTDLLFLLGPEEGEEALCNGLELTEKHIGRDELELN